MADLGNITRRKVLKVGACAILVGAVGIAAVSTTAGTEDPAIAAITEWRDAWDFAWKDAANLTAEEEDSEARQQILDAEYQAQLRAAETRATTIAELPAQLLFAFIVFGDKTYASDPDDPMNYLFPDWTDELDGTTAQHARDGPRTFGSGGTGMIGDLYLGAVLAVRRRITCDVNCAFDPVWTANLPGCVPAHAETAPDYDPAGPSGPAFMPYANGLSQGALRQGSISPRPHRSMDALDARRADADLVQSLGQLSRLARCAIGTMLPVHRVHTVAWNIRLRPRLGTRSDDLPWR